MSATEEKQEKEVERDIYIYDLPQDKYQTLVFTEVSKKSTTGVHVINTETRASLCDETAIVEDDEHSSDRTIQTRSKITGVAKPARLYDRSSAPHSSDYLCPKCRDVMVEMDQAAENAVDKDYVPFNVQICEEDEEMQKEDS